MKPARFADWPERLADFLEARKMSPKAWGFNDCALFCADAIEIMTGVDVAIEFRGEYRHAAGAARAMARFLARHGADVSDWRRERPGELLPWVADKIAQMYEFQETIPARAQRGDAVLLDVGDLLPGSRWTTAMGIIGMNGMPVTAGEQGIVALPPRYITRAWKI